jgi:hypothetical protein
MPVPTTISDMTNVAATNSPQGTETVKGTIDDYLRAHGAFIRQLFDQLLGPSVSLASAAKVDIGFASSANIVITGTTGITAFDTVSEGTMRWVTFSGALTLTHNATSLQLPGSANIATAAGDVAVLKSLGAGNWKCMAYQRVAGTNLFPATNSRDGYLSAADWAVFNGKQAQLGFTPYNASNPSNFVSAESVAAAFFPKSGGALTGPLTLPAGSQGAPSLAFDNDTGLFQIGDGVIGIVCNGVLVGKFTSAGLEVLKITQSQ